MKEIFFAFLILQQIQICVQMHTGDDYHEMRHDAEKLSQNHQLSWKLSKRVM